MSENIIDFEKSLASLESIISKLESGDSTLDASITLFEQGMQHISDCKTALSNAESRITKLADLEKEKSTDD